MIDRHAPFPGLLLDSRSSFVRQRRIEYLSNSTGSNWSRNRIGAADSRTRISGFFSLTLSAGSTFRLCLELVVDLFGAHLAEPVVHQNSIREMKPGAEYERIDRVVAGLVPPFGIAP